MTNDDFFNHKNQIYGFAFGKGNVSAYTLWKLRNIDCCYQVFGEGSIDGYIDNFLMREQPGYILGLGIYSGRDQDKIRIETKCSNKFRNGFMDDGKKLIEFDINPFLEPGEMSKFSEGIGNSYCNMASWKIMSKIGSGELKSKYSFLHIPRAIKTWQAVREIDELLRVFRQSIGLFN